MLDICSTFIVGSERYRATGFYKVSAEQAVSHFEKEPYTRYIVQHCVPEEAHFVSGAGVAGTISLLKDTIDTGVVKWSENQIQEAKDNYKNFHLSEGNQDRVNMSFDKSHRMKMYLEWEGGLQTTDSVLHGDYLRLTRKYHRLMELHYRHYRNKNRKRWKKYFWDACAVKMRLYKVQHRMWQVRVGEGS